MSEVKFDLDQKAKTKGLD